MMKRYFLFVLMAISINATGQVSLYPEVGFNYRPYKLYDGVFTKKLQSYVDPFIGIVGDINVSPKFMLRTSVGYIFRKRTESYCYNCGFIPDTSGGQFINRDLNVSISGLYPLFSNFKTGIGVGLFHKLGAYHLIGNPNNNPKKYIVPNQIVYNTNAQFIFDFDRIRISAIYYLLLPPLEFGENFNEKYRHSFSIGVGYDFLSRKKK